MGVQVVQAPGEPIAYWLELRNCTCRGTLAREVTSAEEAAQLQRQYEERPKSPEELEIRAFIAKHWPPRVR